MITKMPFLYLQSPDPRLGPTLVEKEVYLVRIASFDYVRDGDPSAQQITCIAASDMVSEEHTFSSEAEALTYMQEWWSKPY